MTTERPYRCPNCGELPHWAAVMLALYVVPRRWPVHVDLPDREDERRAAVLSISADICPEGSHPMSAPIAYTYDADTHCPQCTVTRFGRAMVVTYSATVSADYPPESARDSESNPVGAIFSWDEWHEDGPGIFRLVCGTCSAVIDECDHGPDPLDADPDECTCDNCRAMDEEAGSEPARVTCDICGEYEWTADLTPDWNGDTGCHLSCEREAALEAQAERRYERD